MAFSGRKTTPWYTKPPMGVLINWAHPLAGRLVSLWDFNERGGMSVADLAQVKTKGTMQAGASWVGTGKWGAAIDFDHSTGHIQVSQQGRYGLSSGPFTVAFAIRDDTVYSSLGTYHRILSWYDGSKNIQAGLGQGASSPNRMFYLINSATAITPQIISAGDCGLGHHIVVITFDGTNYAMYLDGKETSGGGSGGGAVTVYTSESNTLYIGQRGGGAAYIDGQMDLVAIWARALSADEARTFTSNPFALFLPAKVYFTGGPQTQYGSAVLAGTGDLTGAAWATLAAVGALSGTGALSATAWATYYAVAALAGTGTLSATAAGIIQYASALLGGTGSLSAAALRVVYAVAALSGTGSLLTAALRTTYGSTTLSGLGDLSALALRIALIQALLQGQGSLTATATTDAFTLLGRVTVSDLLLAMASASHIPLCGCVVTDATAVGHVAVSDSRL